MEIGSNLVLASGALGLDSFVAGLAAGPLLRGRAVRAGFAALFGLCDGAATLVGAALPHRLPDLPDAALYAAAVAVFVTAAASGSRLTLCALPVLLSLDNLAAGAPAAAAPMLALASAAMAAAGLVAGAAAHRALAAA